MLGFNVQSWAAVAPGLDSPTDWSRWFEEPAPLSGDIGQTALKKFPPMLRRRLGTLGRCAVSTALMATEQASPMPAIFASRHGDTSLTLSLLEGMGRSEPMSPTGFSLAVHNAVSGLYTIGLKDHSAVTAIAASEGLVVQALIESVGQLLESPNVLLVIYDTPLPELYQQYTDSVAFPCALALVLSRSSSSFSLAPIMPKVHRQPSHPKSDESILDFIRMLCGLSSEFQVSANGQCWSVKQG